MASFQCNCDKRIIRGQMLLLLMSSDISSSVLSHVDFSCSRSCALFSANVRQ